MSQHTQEILTIGTVAAIGIVNLYWSAKQLYAAYREYKGGAQ